MPLLRNDRRHNYRLPKYRWHKATGQARVTLNGQDFILASSTPKSAGRNTIVWYLSGKLAAGGCAPSDLSVNELADQYLAFAKEYYVKDGRKTDTVDGIKRAITWLCQHYGDKDARDFGPLSLLAIQQRIVAEGKSRRYVNEFIDRLRRLFKWGASRDLVPVTVHQALQTVPGLRRGRTTAYEPPPIMPVSDAVVELTLRCDAEWVHQ